jgi:predicted AAA+ superfamily ATPase
MINMDDAAVDRTQRISGILAECLQIGFVPQVISSNYFTGYLLPVSSIFEGLKVASEIPLIYFESAVVHELKDIAEELRHFCREIDNSAWIALVVLIGDDSDGVRIRELLERKLRSAYGIDIVLLEKYDLQWMVASNNPKDVLRRLVLDKVDLKILSPFVTRGPVPDHIFFDREREIRQIIEHAVTSSFALTGGRRIGKTSILSALHRNRLPNNGYVSILHDCSTTPLARDFLTSEMDRCTPENSLSGIANYNDLFQVVGNQSESIVILLDEVDPLVITDRQDGWPLFKLLRSLAVAQRLQIVLTGERVLRDVLRSPDSPLFNFTSEILIGPLDFHAASELVTKPMKKLEIKLIKETEIVQRIFELTSGHPNVIQLLCSRIIDRLGDTGNNKVSMDDLNSIISTPEFQIDDFLFTFWDKATPLEKIISMLMAQQPKSYRLNELLKLLKTKSLRPEPEVVSRALDRLVNLRSILNYTQSGYQFATNAFPNVIKNSKIIEDLLLVEISEYSKNPQEKET